MDLGKIISWVVVAGIGYGLYLFLSSGDITLAPPTRQELLKLANADNRNVPKGNHLATGKECTQKGGRRIKGGVYSCEIQVLPDYNMYPEPVATYNILVTKRNGKWVVTK